MDDDYDFKIEQTKKEIIEYYDAIKNLIDIQGQTVLATIQNANRTKEVSLKTYLKFITRIESIQSGVMRKFNIFIEKNAEKAKIMSKEGFSLDEGLISVYAACEGVLTEDGATSPKTKTSVYKLKKKEITDIKNLYLNNRQITSIDENCFNNMLQLETLNLSYNCILNLKANTFNQLKSLNRLGLSNCGVSTISNGVFTGLEQLQYLDLSHNPITLIESNALVCLKSLKQLSLSSLADNLMLEDGVFFSLDNLQELDLSWNDGFGNCLKPKTFSHLRSLKKLDISRCKITTIDSECFSQMTMLQELNLNGNKIARLDTRMFIGLKKLEKLRFDKILSQTLLNGGKNVSQREFEQSLKNLTNKDIKINFIAYH